MSVGFLMFLCFALVTITYSRNTRIIEGSYADINDYSFYASVRRISDNLLLCGGAIITNKHILTAAHCFPDLLYAYVNSKIVTGTSNITANPGNTHLPKKIYIHPGFTSEINEQKFMYNDVAVIKATQ
ncbi:PREDICTED: venom serine protease 34-like [Ceratosolen solmsi marchali]|uniref:Venom serine protease 34-like n=1 Tax=Ceratosolen solmsi marchali TaxID=326594 RepID=A0AAJ7E0N0_9HYME|nr:PREDICTED: venom serine protease 34-like [Ceratosolen solmsi marchali]